MVLVSGIASKVGLKWNGLTRKLEENLNSVLGGEWKGCSIDAMANLRQDGGGGKGLAFVYHQRFSSVKQKSADSQCRRMLVARVASYYYLKESITNLLIV